VPEIKFKTLVVFEAQISHLLVILFTFKSKEEAEQFVK